MLIKRPRLPDWRQDHLLVWRLINWVVVGILLASVLLSSYFIYVYIFQTLESANAIAILNANSNYDVVNLTDFKIVEEKVAVKQAVEDPENSLRNIFIYDESNTALQPNSPTDQTKPER
ncbi:MAG: hypothetical protein Q7K39_01355 [Candidatus Magasanikbacteria bacterium]|nr:hypothetical protein [Candidatus Magasanikbacteria bacterium]